MKKILFITQLLPYPPYSGGKLKTFKILKILAQKYHLQVICFHDQKHHQKNAQKLSTLLNIKVKSFHWPVISKANKKLIIKAVASLFSLKPFRVYKYFNPKLAKYITKLTSQHNFNIIYLDHNTSYQYLKYINKSTNSKVIYDEHNLDYLAMQRTAKHQINPLKKIFFYYDSLKLYLYEKSMLKKLDLIFCISQTDLINLKKLGAQPSQLKHLPVPFKPNNQFQFHRSKSTILFVGLMSWEPNIKAFWWFYKKIFPLIKQKLPSVKLIVIGPLPSKKLLCQATTDNSLQVTGQVPTLISYYKKANALVAPILFGGGIRLKILHALAHGIPTISTTIGAEGINPKSLLIANTKEDFAKKTIKILTQPKLAKQFSQAGLTTIKTNYSQVKTSRALNLIES